MSQLAVDSGQLPVGYKQTEVGVIPEDWDCLSIGELNPFITSGSREWAGYYSTYGDLFVRITNMQRQSIYLDLSDNRYVALPGLSAEGKRTALQNGDVLVSITADIGISGYVDDTVSKPAYINQHIALVRFDSADIDSRFISYFLASEGVQKLFKARSDQGAKAGMSLQSVHDIKVAVPQYKEQIKISKALFDVDTLITSLEKLIAKKRAIKTATMQQLLTGKKRLPEFERHPNGELKGYKQTELGEIPEDWVASKLPEVVWYQEGPGLRKWQFTQKGLKVINVTNLQESGFLNLDKTDRHISWDEFELSYKHFMIDEDDFVMASSGNSYCKSSSVRKCDLPLLMNTSVIRFKPKNDLSRKYMEAYLKSKYFKEQIDLLITGGAQPNFGPAHLEKILIPHPALDTEQESIAQSLSDVDTLITSLEKRLTKTQQLKQGMMQELLTGRTRLI